MSGPTSHFVIAERARRVAKLSPRYLRAFHAAGVISDGEETEARRDHRMWVWQLANLLAVFDIQAAAGRFGPEAQRVAFELLEGLDAEDPQYRAEVRTQVKEFAGVLKRWPGKDP